ncbi:MAG: phosphoribosylformylglycinamidine synthase subunit PurS [Deltaproteobacteria bacterium]|nr:phosphoribosylformylglycinamidine synthase subunit PurS [Deltaproteobacteria bacterium]
MTKAKIYVMLKEGVLDPQGGVIQRSLASLSFKGVAKVRQGKVFEILLETHDRREAERQVQEMCRQLLVNPVIERYDFVIEGTP